ncbi:MAG: nitroreductase family deazaflavin-dependent oxidoreductase [Actinomycetota bacterium]|nr:nitroreductase family deazaflavin-dependent oxidoreductase [Actinomycetota bacterium]
MGAAEGRRRPGPGARVIRALGGRRWFTRLTRLVAYPVDTRRWRRTGRSPDHRDFPHLVLVTTGRRSGAPHAVPLLYLERDAGLVVVGSNWGRDRHPAWSSNLLADPRATVHIGGSRREVVARIAADEERRDLWPRLLELWPAWAAYEEWTARRFRVFILEIDGREPPA